MRIDRDAQLDVTRLNPETSEAKPTQAAEIASHVELSQPAPAGANLGAKRLNAESNIGISLLSNSLQQLDSLKSTTKAKKSAISESSPRLVGDPKAAAAFVQDFNNKLKLDPTQLAEKYAKMTEDPHSFMRAMPALFYRDLSGAFATRSSLLNRPAPRVLINGDMHLENFGTFRGPDKHAVWGINDYDQADIGSPEWDLERLSTSAVLVARSMNLGEDAEKQLVKDIGKKYFDTIKDIAAGRESGPSYLTADQTRGGVQKLIGKADDEKRKKFLEKYTSVSASGDYKFLNNDKLRPVSASRAGEIKSALKDYDRALGDTTSVARPLRVLDVIEKLGSGGSSYGLPRYYAMVANDEAGKGPIILEIKGLLSTPIKEQSGDRSRANASQVVDNQHELNGYANPLTGAAKIGKESFLVRELEPEKNNIETNKLTSATDLTELAEQAARVLARAHGQQPEQAQAINDWVGNDEKKATKNLSDFARAYADQMTADQRELKAQLG